MSADIINLRQARKQKARALAEVKASENRARSGRSKMERQLADKTTGLEARKLDGHRRSSTDHSDD